MNQEFELARQAMASLELYQRNYASGEPYQKHKAEIIGLLRIQADSMAYNDKVGGAGRFVRAFADALQQS